MSSPPLYQLAPEYRRVLDMLYDSAGEDGQIPEECMVVLRGATERFEEKITQCCQALEELSGTAEIFKAEESRLAARRKALDARSAWLKEYIFESLKTVGRTAADKALEAGTFRLKICKSPDKLEITDENAVPTDYDEVPERKICAKAVKEAIAAGVEVPGARIVSGTYLKIS